MGSVVSGPLTALATCLGSCLGGCIAKGCCALAGSGNVNNAYAARCVMLWLQVFTTFLAWICSSTSTKWLPSSCKSLPEDLHSLGVCECLASSEDTDCWKDQIVYRTEASLVVILLCLLLMAVSGCAQAAARSHSVAKFMLVFFISLVSLFIPNSVFATFGTICSSAAAIFLAVQSIFVIDFGYTWAERWFTHALEAQRREIGENARRAKTAWLASILVCAALLLAISLTLCIYLYVRSTSTSARIVDLVAMLISVALLVVSILDWCEHGSLLCSAVVMTYVLWLVYVAVSTLSEEDTRKSPTWVGLAVCCFFLVAFAMGVGKSPGSSSDQDTALVDAERGAHTEMRAGSQEETAAGGQESRSGGDASQEGNRGEGAAQTSGFSLQCAVHAAAALYITSALAPKVSSFTYIAHVAAVFTSLGLYAWSLIAPKVLTSRNFN